MDGLRSKTFREDVEITEDLELREMSLIIYNIQSSYTISIFLFWGTHFLFWGKQDGSGRKGFRISVLNIWTSGSADTQSSQSSEVSQEKEGSEGSDIVIANPVESGDFQH